MRYAYSVTAVRAAERSLLAQQNFDDELMRLAARGVAATAASMLGSYRRVTILVGPGGNGGDGGEQLPAHGEAVRARFEDLTAGNK